MYFMNNVQVTEEVKMFKQLFTLARARSEDATQAVIDANALSLLRQQLRDAAVGVEKSRKSLAVVMAYAEREQVSLTKVTDQISDLETRALEALEQDKEELAIEASEAIATLEAEATATRHTIDTYTTEITRLRKTLKQSEAQLTELKRGQRLAQANERALHVRGSLPAVSANHLADATATLDRLKERQEHAEATAIAMTELSTEARTDTLSDRLAAAGCGTPKQSDAAAVLERLKAKKRS